MRFKLEVSKSLPWASLLLWLALSGCIAAQQVPSIRASQLNSSSPEATQLAKPEAGQPENGQLIGMAPASFLDHAELASQLVELATAPESKSDEELHEGQLASLEAGAAALPSEAAANATSGSGQSQMLASSSSRQPPVYRSQPKQISDPAEIAGKAGSSPTEVERSDEGEESGDLRTAAGHKKKKKVYKVKVVKKKKKKPKKKKKIIVVHKKKKKKHHHHHHHHVKHHHHHKKHHKKPKYKLTMHKVKKGKKKKKKLIAVKKHKKASKKHKKIISAPKAKESHSSHHDDGGHHEGGGGGSEGGSGHSSASHGGGGGGHGHGKYYEYAEVPKKGAWKFGYKRGNEKHEIERKEEGHKSHFKTEVKWHDKKGKGKHIWDYNHHEKKKHQHHAAAASNEQPAKVDGAPGQPQQAASSGAPASQLIGSPSSSRPIGEPAAQAAPAPTETGPGQTESGSGSEQQESALDLTRQVDQTGNQEASKQPDSSGPRLSQEASQQQ